MPELVRMHARVSAMCACMPELVRNARVVCMPDARVSACMPELVRMHARVSAQCVHARVSAQCMPELVRMHARVSAQCVHARVSAHACQS